MSKLKLKSKLSSAIESKALALAMLVIHGESKELKPLANKILKAYIIRGKIK